MHKLETKIFYFVSTKKRKFFLFYKYKDEKQNFYVYRNRKQYNLTPPARVSDLTTPGILNDIADRLPN